ncbi:MAG TPA: hypothetical protein VFD17_02240 [Clostridia bacterium]|nr:hypothetical protein [Clostridia bacterium]
MKINGIQPSAYVEPIRNVKTEHPKREEKDKELLNKAVEHEPSQDKKPVTYTKTGHIYDQATINKLKRQSEEAYSYLRGLVEKLLLRQGHSIETITMDEWDKIKVDETARLEAQSLIEPGGPLSAEAVSDRIVDFAKAISGGDIEKLDKLKGAIEKGFKQAEAILGELPEISRKTYDLIMEKLDAWVNEATE